MNRALPIVAVVTVCGLFAVACVSDRDTDLVAEELQPSMLDSLRAGETFTLDLTERDRLIVIPGGLSDAQRAHIDVRLPDETVVPFWGFATRAVPGLVPGLDVYVAGPGSATEEQIVYSIQTRDRACRPRCTHAWPADEPTDRVLICHQVCDEWEPVDDEWNRPWPTQGNSDPHGPDPSPEDSSGPAPAPGTTNPVPGL